MSVSSGWSVQNKWSAVFGVWVLHGVIALWQFVILPADKGSFFLGLSFQRTLMSGVLFFWVIFNVVLIIAMTRMPIWSGRLQEFLKKTTVRDGALIIAFAAVILRFFSNTVLGLLQQSGNFSYVTYAERLSPILNLMTYVSLEIILIVLFFNVRDLGICKKIPNKFFGRILIVLAVLGLVSLFISLTDLGIASTYKGDWARGLPAVPLLEWQIILACLFCFGMIIFETSGKIVKFRRLDLWISLAVWLLTVVFWLGQPIVPNPSALEPMEPNYETYPFIDAQMYDGYAQSILIGDGLRSNEIPQRPIYIVFLAFLHVLVGQDYDHVILAQSLFLALFPVLLYLFGAEFFGRPVGISIALLAVLRDYTSNIVSPYTGNLSYSKLYLSEIPTAMLLILFLLVGLRWIKFSFPVFLGLLMGGVLGTAMLIRTQVMVALPVILFFAFVAHPKKITPIIKGALLATLGVVLVVSPWLWRNWQITGELMFDNPASQTMNLTLRYSRLNGVDVNDDILPLPGEANSDYNDRLLEIAGDAISSNPWGALKGITNSFLNHGVNNILLFPLRNELKDFGELWIPTQAFWERWEGRPNLSQGILLGFYVFLFGLGLTTAWQRNGWLGFLPLALNLVYNLWTSLALLSGQRFLLAMDWSVYLYYMIGIFALLSAFMFTLENGRSMIVKWYEANAALFIQHVDHKKTKQYIFASVLFFGIGLSILLSERIFPERYPVVSQDVILNKVLSAPALGQTNVDSACFQKIIGENHLSLAEGRTLYPRYYAAGTGEFFTDAVGYKTVNESRLVFEMVGQINTRIVFPITEMPEFFPNASDVTLGFDASNRNWFVLVAQGDTQKLYLSDLFDPLVCE